MSATQLLRAIFMTPLGLATLAANSVLGFVGIRFAGTPGEIVAGLVGGFVLLRVAAMQVRRQGS
jgi:hypothetical protein